MRRLLVFLCICVGFSAHGQDARRLGVFGVVDSVSPLVVAGQTVGISDGQRVISPLGPNSKIERGDTLAIVAQVSEGRLIAKRILEIYPAVGPVTASDGKVATVMGSAVHVPPNTNVKVGEWIALSGLWSGNTIITTNIRRLGNGGFSHLTGVIKEQDMTLGGSEVRGAEWPTDGFGRDIWLLSGKPDKTGIQTQLMARGVFGGVVDMVLWQGYASGPIASQTYSIHGTGVMGTAPDREMPAAGDLVVRCTQKGRVLNHAPDGLRTQYDLLGCANHKQVD